MPDLRPPRRGGTVAGTRTPFDSSLLHRKLREKNRVAMALVTRNTRLIKSLDIEAG